MQPAGEVTVAEPVEENAEVTQELGLLDLSSSLILVV